LVGRKVAYEHLLSKSEKRMVKLGGANLPLTDVSNVPKLDFNLTVAGPILW
jgi:hypothetical protein